MNRASVALPLVLMFVLVACGGRESLEGSPGTTVAGDAPEAQLLDGSWVLIAATVDGAPLKLSADYRVTMTINGEAIGGRAACNGYGGAALIDAGAFSLGEISHTEMGCEPDIMLIESTFLDGLSLVTEATRSRDSLSLSGDGVDYSFELLPPVPEADLIGSEWALDTILQGETASSTAAGADTATLTLGPDGTFAGSTGCRAISGEYIVVGDTVQFTSFGAQGDCDPDHASQDSQVISVLEGGFTARIDGGRLTLTGSGGEGLVYSKP